MVNILIIIDFLEPVFFISFLISSSKIDYPRFRRLIARSRLQRRNLGLVAL